MQVAGLLSMHGCACELGAQTNNCAKKWALLTRLPLAASQPQQWSALEDEDVRFR